MNLPSFYDLKYFERVAEFKSFSAAAKNLGISQPSLSVALKRLEENLQLNLLVRGKKGVSLTREGQAFLAKVKLLLNHWEVIYDETQSKKDSLKGFYRFGIHQSIAFYALGAVSKKLIKSFPQLEIEFVHDHSKNITDMIIECKLDFGVVVNPLRHPDLTLIKLFEDKVSFFKSVKNNDFNQLESESLVVLCDRDLAQTSELLKKLNSGKLKKVKRQVYSNNLEVVAEMTAHGSGIGIIPERVAKKYSQKKLEKIEALPSFKDEMYFAFRKDFIHSPAFNKLKSFLIEEFKELK